MYALSQWETTLQCNAFPHWQGAYTKWSLQMLKDICWNINNNAWLTVKKRFYWSQVRNFANDFHERCSQRVKIIGESLQEWQKKSLFIASYTLCYFSRTQWKQSSSAYFTFSNLILRRHNRRMQADLWRHTNVRNWYCDILFVDCSCMCKLVQRWYSLMSINLEFFTTRFSRPNMWELMLFSGHSWPGQFQELV